MGTVHLGQRVRVLREQRLGDSLREAGAKTGLHYTYLGVLEREPDGVLKANGAKIVTLAKYLGVTSDYLLGIEEGGAELVIRQRLAQEPPDVQARIRYDANPGSRLQLSLEWLQEAGYENAETQRLCQLMNFSLEDFQAVLAWRSEPSDYLLDKLNDVLGIPRRWLEYGDFGPPGQLVERVVSHPDSEDYLKAVAGAMDNGISPKSFALLVQTLIAQQESHR